MKINDNSMKFYKLVVSDHLALACTLGNHELMGKVVERGSKGIGKEELEGAAQRLINIEFEKLKNADYKNRAIYLLSQNDSLKSSFNFAKKQLIAVFISDIPDALRGGKLTFSDEKAVDGDYLLTYAREYVSVLYARKKSQENSSDNMAKTGVNEMGKHILQQVEFYKANPEALEEMILILTNNGEVQEATRFAHICLNNMLDQFGDSEGRDMVLAEMFSKKYLDLFTCKTTPKENQAR